nr:germin-like protein 9-3 isoform X2 [Nicotiana tomentosiformis]
MVKLNQGDPYILTDFIVPKDQTGETMDGNFFTFTGLAVLQFSGTGVNPPHTHPRAAELLFMVQRNLQVGLRDSTNKVYTRTLQFGDLFLFPKGLVHYQYNCDWNKSAIAVSATGSANAGTV